MLNLHMDAQIGGFRQRWDVTQVRIITVDGTDIGWLQSFVKDNALFLGQLFVDGALRRQGIGTVVKGLIEEAAESWTGAHSRRGKDQSRPAALRTARVSHHARG